MVFLFNCFLYFVSSLSSGSDPSPTFESSSESSVSLMVDVATFEQGFHSSLEQRAMSSPFITVSASPTALDGVDGKAKERGRHAHADAAEQASIAVGLCD